VLNAEVSSQAGPSGVQRHPPKQRKRRTKAEIAAEKEAKDKAKAEERELRSALQDSLEERLKEVQQNHQLTIAQTQARRVCRLTDLPTATVTQLTAIAASSDDGEVIEVNVSNFVSSPMLVARIQQVVDVVYPNVTYEVQAVDERFHLLISPLPAITVRSQSGPFFPCSEVVQDRWVDTQLAGQHDRRIRFARGCHRAEGEPRQ
jgi:hypothetical protein